MAVKRPVVANKAALRTLWVTADIGKATVHIVCVANLPVTR